VNIICGDSIGLVKKKNVIMSDSEWLARQELTESPDVTVADICCRVG